MSCRAPTRRPQAQPYDGYWRVGGDSTWGGDNYFDGIIDEAAVYSYELPQGRVLAHYQAGGGVVNQAPTAAFTSSANQRRVTFTGTGTDTDGTVAAYSWDFGDGSTSTEQNPTHVYTESGTFTVKLTVTDNKGASGEVTHPVPVTAPAGPADTYGSSVSADNPRIYWRLDETSGNVANDVSGGLSNGTIFNNPTKGVAGAIDNPNTAMQFNINASDQFIASDDQFNNPLNYSEEAWFKTTSGSGGKIIGFGRNHDGLSSSYDRHVYMDGGKLVFGTYTGALNTITTDGTYNDGVWHHVVATQSSDGMKLYVDGQLAGTNPQSSAENYPGYWKVGGDNSWGGDTWFDGDIDEVAVYTKELSAGRILAHYQAAQPAPNQAPVAALSVTKANLDVTANAAGSSDPDGTIDHYEFDFGDGTAVVNSTNPVANHNYVTGDGLAHTYSVKVTVVDNDGARTDKTVSVTVQAANVNPVSSFTATGRRLGRGSQRIGVQRPRRRHHHVLRVGLRRRAHRHHDGPDHGLHLRHGRSFRDQPEGDRQPGWHAHLDPGGGHHGAAEQHPNAAFTASVTKMKVTFTEGSTDPDGTVSTYLWDFGDGTQSTAKNPPVKTYATAGTFTVKPDCDR